MNNTLKMSMVAAVAIVMIVSIIPIINGNNTDGAETLTPVELDSDYLNESEYALDDGKAYTLIEDLNLGSNYIKLAGSLTFDLAGHSITSTNNNLLTIYTLNGIGTVTITDSIGGGSVYTSGNTAIRNNGNLVITGGSFEGNNYAIYQPSNGKSLKIIDGSFEANRALYIEGGTVTIEDCDIKGTTAGIRVSVPNGFIDSSSFINPVITVNDGNITGDFGIVVEGRSNSSFDTTLTVNGGIITGNNGSSVSGNGSRDNTHIVINDGILTGHNNPGIYHPQSGDITVNGGTITGEGGIQFCGSGSLTITGGTIRGTYDSVDTPEKPNDQNDGAIVDGSAVSIVSRGSGYQDDGATIKVTITGGTFISNNNSPISSYRFQKSGNDWVNNDDTNLESSIEYVKIKGGYFEGPINKPSIDFDKSQDSVGKYSISGGTFTGAIEQSFIENGSVIKENSDGSFSVIDEPNTPPLPTWDDDDDYIPPIYVPSQTTDDDDTVKIVACAAAAVVAAMMAAFLILGQKKD